MPRNLHALLALPLSLVAQVVKNSPSLWETWVLSLGWEEPLEESMAMYSSILAWRIPWTEEPCGLRSMGSRQSDMTEQLIQQSARSHVLTEQRVQWPYMTKMCILYNLLGKSLNKQTAAKHPGEGQTLSFVSAALYYLKCPVFSKNHGTCKGTRKYGWWTVEGKWSQTLGHLKAHALHLLDKDFTSTI